MVRACLHPAAVWQLYLECGVGLWLWLQVEHSLVEWGLEEGGGGDMREERGGGGGGRRGHGEGGEDK